METPSDRQEIGKKDEKCCFTMLDEEDPLLVAVLRAGTAGRLALLEGHKG
jgi:hypothetical protein